MDRISTEITHMLRMLAPPFFNGWKEEIWRKAEHLEATDLDFAGLSNRIKAEVKVRGWHRAASAQQQSSSSSEQRSEPRGMEKPIAPTKPALPKRSTGSLHSSSRVG